MTPGAGSSPRRVLIIGTGLIGTSLGLALSGAGFEVRLRDRDPGHIEQAVARGAGLSWDRGCAAPDIVIVAVPPQATADTLRRACEEFPGAVLTDVSSIKGPVVAAMSQLPGARFVGGHPMAGREVSGPAGAHPELFQDRPWVLCPTPDAPDDAVRAVGAIVAATGAVALLMNATDHDRAVALTSHTPQVLASLLAGRLAAAEPLDVQVSGQGLRDTVRIAGSEPELWADILASNREPVVGVLEAVQRDLAELLDALRDSPESAREAARHVIARGRTGVARLPGKHGRPTTVYRQVRVAVPDEPGALADLFAVVGAAGVNLEDVRIEHAFGRPTGFVELSVTPEQAEPLREALRSAGWSLRS